MYILFWQCNMAEKKKKEKEELDTKEELRFLKERDVDTDLEEADLEMNDKYQAF